MQRSVFLVAIAKTTVCQSRHQSRRIAAVEKAGLKRGAQRRTRPLQRIPSVTRRGTLSAYPHPRQRSTGTASIGGVSSSRRGATLATVTIARPTRNIAVYATGFDAHAQMKKAPREKKCTPGRPGACSGTSETRSVGLSGRTRAHTC